MINHPNRSKAARRAVTPEPGTWRWQTEQDLKPFVTIRDGSGSIIARCLTHSVTRTQSGYPSDFEQVKMNGRLIAVAPDLLAAVKDLIAAIGLDEGRPDFAWAAELKAARAAVLKVER